MVEAAAVPTLEEHYLQCRIVVDFYTDSCYIFQTIEFWAGDMGRFL